MVKNYGWTVSYDFKGMKGRQRIQSVYRTKAEAQKAAKMSKGFRSISNARAVKATKKEYDQMVKNKR
jgi:hypothetical protein